jgi:hypothetical protein
MQIATSRKMVSREEKKDVSEWVFTAAETRMAFLCTVVPGSLTRHYSEVETSSV